MSPMPRMILAMAGYLVGLVLLFGAAFVFLTGLADGSPGGASRLVEHSEPYPALETVANRP